MNKLLAGLLIAASAVSTAANAAPIQGLFNTGTDANNVALVGGNGIIDTHYSVLSSTSPGYAGGQARTFKHPDYAANDADSRWISLSASGSPGSNTTVYRLSFDLTGLDAATAQITGSFGADNIGELILNGALTSVSTTNFGFLTNFSLTSGFVSGINTLDIRVTDTGQPTAFRLDNLAGTADVQVPEPAMLGLFGLGAIGLGLSRRRRA